MSPLTPAQFKVLCLILRTPCAAAPPDGRVWHSWIGSHTRPAARASPLCRSWWPRGTRHTLHLRAVPVIEQRDGMQRIVAFTKPVAL